MANRTALGRPRNRGSPHKKQGKQRIRSDTKNKRNNSQKNNRQ